MVTPVEQFSFRLCDLRQKNLQLYQVLCVISFLSLGKTGMKIHPRFICTIHIDEKNKIARAEYKLRGIYTSF